MRGGTRCGHGGEAEHDGLSPRARGNQTGKVPSQEEKGSIPACAGEPNFLDFHRIFSKVYPRVRGGTCRYIRFLWIWCGLSPRARGNLCEERDEYGALGSIPACAGEPCLISFRFFTPTVYPRVRGGTSAIRMAAGRGQGLSPRARGNLVRADQGDIYVGSIPACAGEPLTKAGLGLRIAVYPRVRGGTLRNNWRLRASSGLSPRARGNLLGDAGYGGCVGSIPACAGEPTGRRGLRWLRRVYPRVRGGTRCWGESAVSCLGLSPRARGNRCPPCQALLGAGSIPACAGEPMSCRWNDPPQWVYPRVRGGTPTS